LKLGAAIDIGPEMIFTRDAQKDIRTSIKQRRQSCQRIFEYDEVEVGQGRCHEELLVYSLAWHVIGK
jgi:hypothetical protein